MKKEKHVIVKKWNALKALSKSVKPDLKELEHKASDLIAHLAQLSLNGVEEIEGKSIDLFKDRAWWSLEKHGLLPEYKDEEESPIEEVLDRWNQLEEEEFDVEVNEDEIYKQLEK